MKILKTKTFHKVIFTIKAGAKLTINWCSACKESLSPMATVRELGGVVIKLSVYCTQKVKLEKDHNVDAALIVQLNRSEASSLGLKTALGVIQGEKL